MGEAIVGDVAIITSGPNTISFSSISKNLYTNSVNIFGIYYIAIGI